MSHIDLTPIYGLINEGILTLLGGLAIYLTTFAKNWLQVHAKFLDEQTDAQLANGLNRALSNGVSIAMQKVGDMEKANPNFDTKSWVSNYAANFAISHSQDALDRFGLTPEQLAEKALAYLPTPAVTDGLTGVKIPAPAQVEVKNLQAPA